MVNDLDPKVNDIDREVKDPDPKSADLDELKFNDLDYKVMTITLKSITP